MNQNLTPEEVNQLIEENNALRQQVQMQEPYYYEEEERTPFKTHATRFVLGAVGTLALQALIAACSSQPDPDE